MKKNNNVLMIATLSVLASCSSPESYQSKMSRYTPKQIGINNVPDITISGMEFVIKRGSRAPASSDTSASVETIQSDEATLSNKKLYFLTLFGQYTNISKYSSEFKAPTVSVCPNFHNSLLEHNDRRPAGISPNSVTKSTKKFHYDSTKFNDPRYVATHPELSLPMQKNEINPKVIDTFRSIGVDITASQMSELVQNALDIHISKTYKEILELCEYGVSDNYYIFENMITHVQNTNFTPSDSNMNILLKSTLFSNHALVTSLDNIPSTASRSIASVIEKKVVTSSYSNEVMTRLNVGWAQVYYDHLRVSK